LKLFYQDPVRYAYSFQTYTYVTRIQSILSELDKAKAHYSQPVDFLLLERSILTDRYVFMRLLEPSLEPALVKMYATWFDMYQHLLPFDLQNAKFVYLQTSPEESMARMNKRGRPEEILDAKHSNKEEKQGGVSLTYQHQLHQAHLEFYKKQLKTTWMINSGLCAQDFSSPQSKGFQEILGSLRPLLAIAGYEEKEKEADTNGRSCQTVFGRVC
jgi:deoxycitidine kinase